MSDSLHKREQEFSARDSLLSEEWRTADEQQRLQRQAREAQRIQFEEDQRLRRIQEEVSPSF
jgi:hypothetical protein